MENEELSLEERIGFKSKVDAKRAKKIAKSFGLGIVSGFDIFGLALGIGDKKHTYLGYEAAHVAYEQIRQYEEEWDETNSQTPRIIQRFKNTPLEVDAQFIGMFSGVMINFPLYFAPAGIALLYNLGINLHHRYV